MNTLDLIRTEQRAQSQADKAEHRAEQASKQRLHAYHQARQTRDQADIAAYYQSRKAEDAAWDEAEQAALLWIETISQRQTYQQTEADKAAA